MSRVTQVTPASRRYARALFEAASEQGVLDSVVGDMELLAQSTSHPEVSGWLADPRVEVAAKQKLLDKDLADRVHPLTQGLLGLVARRRRHAVLPQVPIAFRELSDEHLGRLRGTLESAAQLEDGQQAHVEQALSARTGKQVLLETRVDPSLVGGIRVTLGGVRYDGTVRAMIQNLKRDLEQAELDPN